MELFLYVQKEPGQMIGPPTEQCWNNRQRDAGALHHSAQLHYSPAASLCTQLLATVFVNRTSVGCWHSLTLHKLIKM